MGFGSVGECGVRVCSVSLWGRRNRRRCSPRGGGRLRKWSCGIRSRFFGLAGLNVGGEKLHLDIAEKTKFA